MNRLLPQIRIRLFNKLQPREQPMNDISHSIDPNAIAEMKDLADFVAARMALSPEEAVASQPAFERGLREATLKLERAVHSVDLTRMDVEVPGIVIEGKRYRRREKKTIGHYMTLAGPIEVERTTYRARGEHGGETIAALDLRLGLIDGHWTPVAAELASTFMASVPSAESASLLKAAGTMTPSASHLDRVAKHVGEIWEENRVDLEQAVREAERLDLPSPEDVRLIGVSLDGIMVPMKDAPRTPGAGKKDQGPKGHKEAGCATVTFYAADGERLHTIRFARMPESYKRVLHDQLTAELRAAQARYPNAKIVAVADGAKENWRIIAEIAEELGIEVTERLDFFHAAEQLTKGLRAANNSDDQIAEWRTRLRDEHDVVEPVIEELGFLAASTRGKKKKKDVAAVFGYFVNNAHRIDFAEAAAANQPIGSGVQEAACKTLVAERMKRSGMTWRTPGGQAILSLRGLAQSGRLGHAWNALRPTLPTDFDVDPDLGRKLPVRRAA